MPCHGAGSLAGNVGMMDSPGPAPQMSAWVKSALWNFSVAEKLRLSRWLRHHLIGGASALLAAHPPRLKIRHRLFALDLTIR
jgi:hypothetical protein